VQGRGGTGGRRGTHVAHGGGGGWRGRLRDDVQLLLGEALGLIEREARVEHRVLHEDARGAQHEGQEHVHVDVVACAVQPPAGCATPPWVRARGRTGGGQKARLCAVGRDTPQRGEVL
jgi:hypothetical protein